MQQAREMAIAIFRDDIAAACALADLLREEHGDLSVRLLPVNHVTVDMDRIRVVLYAKDNALLEPENVTSLTRTVTAWLRGGERDRTVILTGIDRIELYELPEVK